MPRPDDPEVPMVKGCDLDHIESFCQRQDGGVGRSEWKVAVLTHQLRHSGEVDRLEWNGFEVTIPERLEKGGLKVGSDSLFKHVADLGDDSGGHEQATPG